jgi:hypothetical protein
MMRARKKDEEAVTEIYSLGWNSVRSDTHDWMLDTGAGGHLATRHEWFHELKFTKAIAHGMGGPLLLDNGGTVEMVLPQSKDTITLEKTMLVTDPAQPDILSMPKSGIASLYGASDSNVITLRSKATK